jgi:hypothetical protein
MPDFDEEAVRAIAEKPFEEIQKRLQELIDTKSPEAN